MNRGFTLIEILIGIALVGLISAGSFIGFLQFGRAQSLNTSWDNLENNLNAVRSNAMAQILTKCTTSQTLAGHRVKFETPPDGRHSYVFEEACEYVSPPPSYVTETTQYIPYKTVILPDDVKFVTAPAAIHFVSLSGGISGDSITLQLTSRNQNRSVSVNKTGVISAEEE